MTQTCAADCSRPTDGFVCVQCASVLRRDLASLLDQPHRASRRDIVPGIARALDEAIARQVRFGDRAGSRSTERPVPYDPRASEAAWVLHNTLSTWVRLVVEERRTQATPADRMQALAQWLIWHVEWLRHHHAGHEAVAEIGYAVREARKVVDRPADRWYAGQCGNVTEDDRVAHAIYGGRACTTDLYAKAGARAVTCPTCGTAYDVDARRTWLLERVEDVLATTTEISRAVTSLGHQVTPDSIRGYVRRKRLSAKGETIAANGRRLDLYRVGDVLDLVASERARA